MGETRPGCRGKVTITQAAPATTVDLAEESHDPSSRAVLDKHLRTVAACVTAVVTRCESRERLWLHVICNRSESVIDLFRCTVKINSCEDPYVGDIKPNSYRDWRDEYGTPCVKK